MKDSHDHLNFVIETVTQPDREIVIKNLVEKENLTRAEAIEYIMERWYHGCSHTEGIRRAKISPWAKP